jgi:SOS-response transcriptional repressor LexA
MTPAPEPSVKQRQLLPYLIRYRQQHGISPSIRELQAHFGLRSPSAIQHHLNRLRALALITWRSGCVRSLLPTAPGEDP